MQKPVEPKKILCIHDLSGVGRCSLAVILPVLSVMGFQPVALPTVVLSTHTGGLGTPARMDGSAYGMAALEHYQTLGLQFDCIYTGYLGGEAQVALAEKAFALWPAAYKVVDPVMGDNGKAYPTVTPALVERIRSLCRAADLILPNYTEAQLLLQQQPVTEQLDDAAAQALADALQPLASNAVVTGLPLGKYIGCAGTGADRFVIKKLHISRSFPGTGDLYGAVLIGSLLQGNAPPPITLRSLFRWPFRARPTRRTPASVCGLSRCCPACAPCGRNRRAFYDGQADFEYRAGRAPHPPEHRQRGAHLCLHGLPSASGGPHGLCH